MSHTHTAMTSPALPTPQYTSRYLENIPGTSRTSRHPPPSPRDFPPAGLPLAQ